MEKNAEKFNLVIDFDSTFIKLEALDELARIALADDLAKEEKLKKVESITNRGMTGELSFPTSLQKRLELFSIKQEHIQQLIRKLEQNISKSFLRNKEFFLHNKKNIYIISGGFLDYILPIVTKFGISSEHVLANKFIFQKADVIGFDKANFLAQDDGKVRAVKSLGIKNVVVIGDGWTDYEIRKKGGAKKFIAFSENIRREKVVNVADIECLSFEEVINNL